MGVNLSGYNYSMLNEGGNAYRRFTAIHYNFIT